MRIAPLLIASIAIGALTSCGGGSDRPTAPPPVATPTPAPNFSGTYTGLSTFNVAGQAEVRPLTRIVVTQSGSSITFGDMVVTLVGNNVTFPLGTATVSATNTFAGTGAYQSQGCGITQATTQGRFAGNLMNIQVTITPDRCAESRLVAELSR